MNQTRPAPPPLGMGRKALLWLLFFCFSLALGYPTLNRYDPRQLGRDQNVYYRMVTGTAPPQRQDIPFCFRPLVPAVARPFYWLAQGRVASWNPVWFGMLIANSLFCASFLLLLLMMGYGILGDLPLALLGCTLVLLDYAVPDLWLAGYVDAAEACLLMAVAYCLFTRRWWLLPLLGILGGLAKQSFLPFATVFALAWWLATEKPKRTYAQLGWVAALGVATFASIVVTYRVTAHGFMMPWTMASAWWGSGGLYRNLMALLHDHRFVYPFVWLVPLGVWRLRRFPKPWVAATLSTGLLALAIGIYAGLRGTVNRPIFNVIAPLFALSTASLIGSGGAGRRGPQKGERERAAEEIAVSSGAE